VLLRRLRRSWRALLAAWCAVSLSDSALARVLVFDAEVPARPLAEPLQIQLGPETVELAQQELSGVVPSKRGAFVEAALRAAPAVKDEALLGVWLEARPEAGNSLTAFVVSLRHRDAAAQRLEFLLEPGGPAERALALTIAELYRALQRAPAEPLAARPAPAPRASRPRVRPRAVERSTLRADFAAGQMIKAYGPELSPLLSLHVLAGASWKLLPSPLRLRAHAGAFAQLPRSHSERAGTITYTEHGALLGFSAWWAVGIHEPGLLAEARAVRWIAEASSGSARGERERVEWALALHGATRIVVSSRMRFDVSAGAALQPEPANFVVRGESLASVPRFSPEVRLMLCYSP
jgi:hypothetical protein